MTPHSTFTTPTTLYPRNQGTGQMADHAAWGDDMIDHEIEEVDYGVDWTARGLFRCDICTKVLSTAGGLKCHTTSVHGEEYGNLIKSKIKAAHKAKEAEERAQKAAETKRAQERLNRKVVFSTTEIDEIVTELNSLINMMDPYWSQGNGAKPAYALIERLEAKAEGRS